MEQLKQTEMWYRIDTPQLDYPNIELNLRNVAKLPVTASNRPGMCWRHTVGLEQHRMLPYLCIPQPSTALFIPAFHHSLDLREDPRGR